MARTRPNHALHLNRRERRGCNRCVPCAGSLSLGRSVANEFAANGFCRASRHAYGCR